MCPTRPAWSTSPEAWPPAASSSSRPAAPPGRCSRRASPVVGISDVTGFPEMMDGRVKTLHPLVHGGILARRGRPDDLAAAAAHGITLIDLVVVNLYPFVKAAANPDTPFEALIEEIDIGGPSLVRAAAKNFQDVLVVVSPDDYGAVLDAARSRRRAVARVPLRPGAEGVRAHRQLRHGDRVDAGDDHRRRRRIPRERSSRRTRPEPAGRAAPAMLTLGLRKLRDLRYGENPHQQRGVVRRGAGDRSRRRAGAPGQGAVVHEPPRPRRRRAHRARVQRAGGRGHQAHQSVRRGHRRSAADAYVRAREADALAAFGGIVGLNRADRRGDGAGDRRRPSSKR